MSDTASTRDHLIDAAIDVIAASGEAALRLADIAKRVGVTQPAIYYFFENREDLVVAAHRERFRRFAMEAFRGSDQLDLDRLTRAEYLAMARANLNQALSIERREARAARLQLSAKALTNDALRREINDASFEINTTFARVIAHGQHRGWVRDDMAALTIAAWLRGQLFSRCLIEEDPDRYDGEEWNRLTVEAALQFLLLPADPAAS